MKKRRKDKTIAISAVVLATVGYLVFSGIRDTMVYYLTVSEVLAKQPEQLTKTIKVGGTVTPGSVQWDPGTLDLSFRLEEGKTATLAVRYKGVVPDSFKPGAEVIVEGTYEGIGNFSASTIMPKCASKYE